MLMYHLSTRAVVVLTACLAASSPAFADDAAEATPVVATETVQQGPFRVDVTLSGVFEADETAEIKIETEEWTDLEVVHAVPHGSLVQAGDLLIQFATEELDEEIEQATIDVQLGQLAIAAAQLDLQSSEHNLPLQLEESQRSLTEAREDMAYYNEVGERQAMRSSEISVMSSLASLESAKEELEQLEQMYLADDLTEETEEIILKRARQDVEFSQFYYESSVISHQELMDYDLERRRLQMEHNLRRSEIEATLTESRLNNTLEQDRIDLQKLQLVQVETEERLTNLRNDRELLEVHATVAGRVIYGECDRGTWSDTSSLLESLKPEGAPSTDKVLMTIVVPGVLFVRTDVSEADLRHVIAPQEVHIVPTIDADAKWTGSLRSCNPIAIDDDVFDATFNVEIGSAPVEIMPGMTCDVIVTARFNPEALTLPSEVIFDDPSGSGKKLVYVQTNAGHEARTVTVGLSDGTSTEILEGVEAGDVVLSEQP